MIYGVENLANVDFLLLHCTDPFAQALNCRRAYQ